MSHIFISYSREDLEFARYLRAQLESEGYRVWMDEQRLHPGSDWWDEIERNIITCSAFMILMSPNSANSKWVKREILMAEDNHRPIFPVLVAGKVFGRLADLQAEDMTGGITAKLSDRFWVSLREIIGDKPDKSLTLRIKQGNVISTPADVLILKYSTTFMGASHQVFNGLQSFGVKVDINALEAKFGAYQLLDSKMAVMSSNVLYIATPHARQFKYADLTVFIQRAMDILKEQLPETRHILMTIHGVKFGLDEREAFITQIKAIFDGFLAGQIPPKLEQISIVETDASRVARLIDIADEFTDNWENVKTADGEMGVYQLTVGKTTSTTTMPIVSDAKPYILAFMPPDDMYDDSFYYGIQRPTHAYGLLCERESAEFVVETPIDVENLQNRIEGARGVIIHLDNKPLTPNFALQIGCVWGAKRPSLFITQSSDVQHTSLPQDSILVYKKISELEGMIADYLKSVM